MEAQIMKFLKEAYSIGCYKVKTVTNEIYRCDAKQGTFFVRITNYKTYQEQFEEVSWTNFLCHQGVGASEAVHSSNQQYIEKIMLDEEKLAVVYKAAAGIHLPRAEWNTSVLKKVGKQIGKMHRVTGSYRESTAHLKDWYENKEYDFLTHIPKEETVIREMAYHLLTEIKGLPKHNSNYGLIHGDLWLENILVDGSKITMIDFQDCEKHFNIFDLAVPIYSAMEFSFSGGGNIKDYRQSITQALFNGYREEHDLSSDMVDTLPLFLKLKQLFEYNLMHMYWDHEQLSEEQVRIINLYRMRIEYDHFL